MPHPPSPEGGYEASSQAETAETAVAAAGRMTTAEASTSTAPDADDAAKGPTTATDGPPRWQRRSPSQLDADEARGAAGRPGEGEVAEGGRERSSNARASAGQVAAVDVAPASAPASPPGEYERSIPVTGEGLLLELSEAPPAGGADARPTAEACFAGYGRFPDGRMGPAEEAGLVRSPGDRIVAVEDVSVLGVPFVDVLDTIRRAVVRIRGGGSTSTAPAPAEANRMACRIRFVEAAEWGGWSAEASRWTALWDDPPPPPEGGSGEVEAKAAADATSTTADIQTLSRHKPPPRSHPALGAAEMAAEARKAAEAGEYESAIPVTGEGLLILVEGSGGVTGDTNDAGDGGGEAGGPPGGGEETCRGKGNGEEKDFPEPKVPHDGHGSGKGVGGAAGGEGGGGDKDDGEEIHRGKSRTEDDGDAKDTAERKFPDGGDGSDEGVGGTAVEEGSGGDKDDREGIHRQDVERDDKGGECRGEDDDDAKDRVERKVVDSEDENGKEVEEIAVVDRGRSDREGGDDGEEFHRQDMEAVDKGGGKCGGVDDGSAARDDGDKVVDDKDDGGQGGEELALEEGGDGGGDKDDGEERHCQDTERDDDERGGEGESEALQENDSDEARRRHSRSNNSERSPKSSAAVTASVCFAGYKRFSDGRIGPAQAERLVKSRGDRIVAVENVSVLGLSFDDVVDRIKAVIRVVGDSKTSSTAPPHGGVCRIRFVEAAKWDGWSSEAPRWTALWENPPPPSEVGGGLTMKAAPDATETTEGFPTQQPQNPAHTNRTFGAGNAYGWPAQHPPPTPPQPQLQPHAYWPQHQQHQRPVPFGQYVPMQNHWAPMMPQRYLGPVCSLCCKPIQYGIPQVHFPPDGARGLPPLHLHMTCGKVAFVQGRPDLNLLHPSTTARKIEAEWKVRGFWGVNTANTLRVAVPKVRTSLPEWHGYRTGDSYCLEGELRAVIEEVYVVLVRKKKNGVPKRTKKGAKQSKKRKNEEDYVPAHTTMSERRCAWWPFCSTTINICGGSKKHRCKFRGDFQSISDEALEEAKRGAQNEEKRLRARQRQEQKVAARQGEQVS